ncbi:MAG: sigma-54-dependent Fis family transcriptional regulator [Deltaproteobacteria bacterium]|nr:sigma-54-dependent Fis family transcriptional regulator [Deltaproteobacteria bacterium]
MTSRPRVPGLHPSPGPGREVLPDRPPTRAHTAEPDCGILGVSPGMGEVVRWVRRVAPTDLAVLVTGGSGTGKEVVARAIHRLSRRADHPFVPVDCGAIPRDLMESELFGHERGAFTGADTARPGLVEAAQGGTFFLDEIGELEAGVQARLLRLLQEGEYRRVGGSQMRTASLRIIAATHRDLEKAVRAGVFREDLYHRIHVVRIDLPPLCERPEDVPVLAEHFLRRLSQEQGRQLLELSPAALRAMQAYPWPGNVREVLNCCRYLVGLTPGPVVTEADLPPFLWKQRGSADRPGAPGAGPPLRHDLPYKQARRLWLQHFESAFLRHLLQEHGGNVSKAALAAGIDRKSIQRLMKRHGLRTREGGPGGG